ncbi:HEAT repeat-containing protein 6 [Scleropages formosus]|uniref:HEAT repeat-containing protein 6 n=1 Tax=Scleropages formosus TaxID=113540 RepID=A0A8C9R8S9_SCLFO|nr:HEAT repeat-containing protein 6 [Scleropages formosus]
MAANTAVPSLSGAPRCALDFSTINHSGDAACSVNGCAGLGRGESGGPGVQFSRCYSKLCSLTPSDMESFKTELNLLFDQLISENYYSDYAGSYTIRAEDVCSLLVQASRLVKYNQEHLVIKFCQLTHHLLNRLQVIVDEPSFDRLVSYSTRALAACSPWTHAEILQALAALVYGNGPKCQKYLPDLLGRGGVLVRYSSPSQPDLELRRTAVHCLANLCLGLPGQPYLEESYRSVCFQTFLQILQAPRPPNVDDIVFCMLLQDALKGMQYYLNGAKGKLTAGEHLGTLLAVLKKYMFFGLWGINLEMPTILYPTPLPQYEGVPAAKEDSPRDVPAQSRQPGNKKRKSRGRSKKAEPEAGHGEDDEEAQEAEVRQSPRKAGGGETHSHWSLGPTYAGRPSSVAQREAPPSLYPSWKRSSSDSEFSDPEGGMQSKLRLYQARVRQGALHCFLAAVKCVEKRVLYGYWSSFVPDAPSIGSPPALTLLTIALKDPSPKVRAGSLQVLSALLEGSRKFLSAAEDTGAPRQAFTPFSVTLAGSLRELHRGLVLALVAESSSQTLTQVIKCLAHLVCNVPYGRLRPGLLKTLWQQIGPYVSHRDVNVRVSSLTLLGAVVSAQAPLSEVRLLLQQPPGSGSASGALSGPSTPQEAQPQGGRSGPEKEAPSSCGRLPEGNSQSQCWLLQLCVSLVVQPREDPCSDSDAGAAAPGALEPSPVRLEALQVLAHLVRGYFSLVQAHLLELGEVSAQCLRETDPSIQLHGAKLLEELGSGIIQQYRGDSATEQAYRVPVRQVVQFWLEVLSGPLTGALQNELHPTLQTSACDILSSILPQAFTQLPDKSQLLCITVLLGLSYSENSPVKAAAVRALGVYVLFPCLREDVMFVADTANSILTSLEDRSPNVRAKAAWSLGNLTDTLIVNMASVGRDFQEEFSDMLLLKMLRSATSACLGDKDRVKSNAVRALGNLLHFLQPAHLSRSGFEGPMDEAVRALIDAVRSDATMKVRWNACYALGNAFRNPALPLGTAPWTADAYSALSQAVTCCRNFKVRIKSAAALSVPAERDRYGGAAQFGKLWRALARALECSNEAEDFLEYRYCAGLRTQLCRTLLHLMSLCQPDDLPAVAAPLAEESRPALHAYFAHYHLDEGNQGQPENDGVRESCQPQEKLGRLEEIVAHLRSFPEMSPHTREAQTQVVSFLEEVLRSCHESQAPSPLY